MKKNPEYEKIPKSLKLFTSSEKLLNDINKLQWVVTEKVHGANFSFIYENRKLFFAKRKEYLDWHDDFFGFQLVVANLEGRLLQLFEALSTNINAEKYIVYGELFGGKYPHTNTPSHFDVDAIQTGVYYSPSINFCAFDIAIEVNDEKKYLDYSLAINYFEQFGILYAKILFSGKLHEALDFNTRINSTIPQLLNLPEIENNVIEGIVVKPLSHNGIKDLDFRPIIKIKNKEFDEEKKFHESEKWSFTSTIYSKNQELSYIVEELVSYINENRLNSAISKIGKIDNKNEARLQQIHEEVINDIWFDFNENNKQFLNELNSEQQLWIKDRIKPLISIQIKIL